SVLAGACPRFDAMAYAIISLGGKQYRVQEGERLLVDRVPTEEGKTFHPDVLMLGGDGTFELAPKAQVTVRVVGSALGNKVTIGKYKPKSGYRRKTGFRAKLSQIEIQSIGGGGAPAARRVSAPSSRRSRSSRSAARRSAARLPRRRRRPRRRPRRPRRRGRRSRRRRRGAG